MSASPIAELFDGISPRYDTLNHLLSFNIDRLWRRKTAKTVAQRQPDRILDLATGTADLAINLAKQMPQAHITGVDLSERMLAIGKAKVTHQHLEGRVNLHHGDAMALPFDDDSFDAVTVAFGVRNFDDREAGLREIARVCRDGGQVAVLEFSHPQNPLIAVPYRWYSKTLLPWLGQLVSKHPTAYRYLPSSVEAFPPTDDFVTMLAAAGMSNIQVKAFSSGIATLYHGIVTKTVSAYNKNTIENVITP